MEFKTKRGGQLVFRVYDKGRERSMLKNRISVPAEEPGGKGSLSPHPEACSLSLFHGQLTESASRSTANTRVSGIFVLMFAGSRS